MSQAGPGINNEVKITIAGEVKASILESFNNVTQSVKNLGESVEKTSKDIEHINKKWDEMTDKSQSNVRVQKEWQNQYATNWSKFGATQKEAATAMAEMDVKATKASKGMIEMDRALIMTSRSLADGSVNLNDGVRSIMAIGQSAAVSAGPLMLLAAGVALVANKAKEMYKEIQDIEAGIVKKNQSIADLALKGWMNNKGAQQNDADEATLKLEKKLAREKELTEKAAQASVYEQGDAVKKQMAIEEGFQKKIEALDKAYEERKEKVAKINSGRKKEEAQMYAAEEYKNSKALLEFQLQQEKENYTKRLEESIKYNQASLAEDKEKSRDAYMKQFQGYANSVNEITGLSMEKTKQLAEKTQETVESMMEKIAKNNEILRDKSVLTNLTEGNLEDFADILKNVDADISKEYEKIFRQLQEASSKSGEATLAEVEALQKKVEEAKKSAEEKQKERDDKLAEEIGWDYRLSTRENLANKEKPQLVTDRQWDVSEENLRRYGPSEAQIAEMKKRQDKEDAEAALREKNKPKYGTPETAAERYSREQKEDNLARAKGGDKAVLELQKKRFELDKALYDKLSSQYNTLKMGGIIPGDASEDIPFVYHSMESIAAKMKEIAESWGLEYDPGDWLTEFGESFTKNFEDQEAALKAETAISKEISESLKQNSYMSKGAGGKALAVYVVNPADTPTGPSDGGDGGGGGGAPNVPSGAPGPGAGEGAGQGAGQYNPVEGQTYIPAPAGLAAAAAAAAGRNIAVAGIGMGAMGQRRYNAVTQLFDGWMPGDSPSGPGGGSGGPSGAPGAPSASTVTGALANITATADGTAAAIDGVTDAKTGLDKVIVPNVTTTLPAVADALDTIAQSATDAGAAITGLKTTFVGNTVATGRSGGGAPANYNQFGIAIDPNKALGTKDKPMSNEEIAGLFTKDNPPDEKKLNDLGLTNKDAQKVIIDAFNKNNKVTPANVALARAIQTGQRYTSGMGSGAFGSRGEGRDPKTGRLLDPWSRITGSGLDFWNWVENGYPETPAGAETTPSGTAPDISGGIDINKYRGGLGLPSIVKEISHMSNLASQQVSGLATLGGLSLSNGLTNLSNLSASVASGASNPSGISGSTLSLSGGANINITLNVGAVAGKYDVVSLGEQIAVQVKDRLSGSASLL